MHKTGPVGFRLLKLTLPLFFMIYSLGFSQEEKIRIVSIDVIGTKTATPEVLIAASGLKVGGFYGSEEFADAIKQIWSLGLFSDVKLINDRELDGGVYLIIAVEEYPRLSKIGIQGNRRIKASEIEEVIDVQPGQPFSPHNVYEMQCLIEELYYEKDFLLVEVIPATFEGIKENTRGVTIEIKENKKVKLENIVIEGVSEQNERKLKRQMEHMKEQSWWKFWTDLDFTIDNLRRDERTIEAYLRSKGYRDAEVLGDSISYNEERTRMYLHILVNQGPQNKYGEITVSGNALFEDDELLKGVGISTGDTYDSEKLMENLELGVRGPYMDRGYLYAEIIPQEIPIAADTVDLTLQIVEMNPVTVRLIEIEGNDRTKENVIRRELKIYPGDTFSRKALIRSQREVMILNYFANVTPDVVPYEEDQIDLIIDVEEKNTGTATASAGYGEQDGFIGTVGLQFPNFRGNGQTFGLKFQRAYSYQSVSMSFVEPWLFGTPNMIGISIFDTDQGLKSSSSLLSTTTSTATYYDLHSRGGSLTIGRRFKWPDNYFNGTWRFNLTLNEYDTTKVYDWDVFNLVNPAHIENSWGISVIQNINRDSRNEPEFPTMGSKLALTSMYSGGLLGGNENFFKQQLSLEMYSPLYSDKLTMRSNFEFGYLVETSSDSSSIIPYDEYFFMGGAGLISGSALRGYPERSVGTLEGSTYWGGKSSFKYSFELRYLLNPNPMMYLIGFAEAGNVFDRFESTDMYDLKRSVGLGGRIIMPPLGMLGIDLGWGFDREALGLGPATFNSPEFHFIFGQQF